ncbi:MAG: hypothetical protein EKK48_12280 [Candidatus Melainabacteria bacterium]|nr:MAG: hypothetical protein EKK48_12280 [Candidatus Melainabacteria bacterium]
MSTFFTDKKITKVAAAATSAGTAVNGTGLSMEGFENVIFMAAFGTANAGNYLKAQGSADNSTWADIKDSKATPGADGDLVALELYETSANHAYVRPVGIRAGANTTLGDIIAIQTRSKVKPTTQPTGTVAKTVYYTPEGTP